MRRRTGVALVALAWTLGGLAQAGESARPVAQDVGLITQLVGQVSWKSGSTGKTEPATAFMKVRLADHLTLEQGAVLRVVYFKTGRHETWNGPAAFAITAAGSEKQGQGAAPVVIKLPARASRDVRRIPDLMRSRLGITRSGSGQQRGGNKDPTQVKLTEFEREELAAARQIYSDLRKKIPLDDVTPELYLMSVLDSLEQYEEAVKVAQRALAQQPDNAYLKRIMEELSKRGGIDK